MGTFTTSVVDGGSSPAAYAGSTFKVTSIATTTVAVALSTPTTYVAGSTPETVTVTLSSGQAGVPIVLTAPGYPSTATYSFSPSSGSSGASGTLTSTFQPSNAEGNNSIVTATIGTSGTAGSSGLLTTAPAAPSTVTFHYAAALASNGNDYSTTTASTASTPPAAISGDAEFPGSGILFSLSDKFSNAIALNTAGLTAYTITLTALSGGGFFDASYAGALAHPSVIACSVSGSGATIGNWNSSGTVLTSPATTACASGGGSSGQYALPFNYFQSGIYGTIGKLGATLTGTYSSGAFSGSGSSANLVTSTFSTSSPTPSVAVPTGATYTLAAVPAGTSVTVSATLGTPQAGVPVTLYLDRATSFETAPGAKDYSTTAAFTNGAQAITLASATGTGSLGLGVVSSTFAVDTLAMANAFFLTAVAQPTNTNPAAFLANSSDSATAAVTVAGPAASFVITGCLVATSTPSTCSAANTLGTKIVNGSTAYIDVSVADAYGNAATNPGPNQFQITLSAPGSVLSATTAYITSGNPDTYTGTGWVAWTLPATIGTSITLSATGVLNGQVASATFKVTTVSGTPTFAITSPAPLNGVIYSSSTAVVFSGQANASVGYPATVTINSIGYKVDSGTWQSGVVSAANKVIFSLAASMTVGLHTVTFNATDSNGNTFVSSTFTVLVDTTAPTVKFVTANNANLTNGAAVMAQVNDTFGDLNATSVVATATNIDTAATATPTVSITGSNNPGHAVSYSVSISGLTSGNWSILLTAADLAGNTVTSSALTVHVSVPLGQSFVVVGTPTKATLAGYSGVNATYTNLNPTSESVVVFAVWKTGAVPVGVSAGSATVGAGATQSIFVPAPIGLPSGTYTVQIFVVTTGNLPVSVTTTITVTI
ncbi:MAG: hypothetical protein JRN06_07190 [Nitrososphaerota archaeon]|nr:hypothetical protein [Nitrososphaerota archaeon]MDG7024435.1 hypothetical protein [Nitrososphaerota archaeon]